MTDWDHKVVGESLEKALATRGHQIPSSLVAPSGRYPVVDQGQAFIAGYTDDTHLVIDEPLPLIVFGDHTRSLKYVDFPFVAGADGTKLLRPRSDWFDARFFYYALRHANIPSRGYNRHFTLLKAVSVPRPEKVEQEAIAATLAAVDEMLASQERRLDCAEELKQAILGLVFGSFSQSESPDLKTIAKPSGWRVRRIGEVAELKSGGTPSRDRPEYWEGGTIPWVKTAEVDNGYITETEEHITDLGLANSSARLFPAGTLLMAMYGQGVTRGKVAVLDIEAATNQACVAFFPDDEVSSSFLYYFLQSRYVELREYGHGANQKNLSADIIKGIEVAYPPDPDEQSKIVALLSEVDRRINIARATRDTARELVDSLLSGLMSQELSLVHGDREGVAHTAAAAV